VFHCAASGRGGHCDTGFTAVHRRWLEPDVSVVCEYGQVHQENGSPISGPINIKNLSPEKPDFGRAVLFWGHIKAFQRSACLSAYSTAHYWCCASSGSLKTCIKLVRALLFFLVCHLVF